MLSAHYQNMRENANRIIPAIPSGFRYMPLRRRPDDDGGGWAPPLPLPENLRDSASEWEQELSRACWDGWPCDKAELQAAVDADIPVAILPERSGLIIIDCDVKRDFVLQPDGSAVLEITEDGEQDLQKVMAELGLADVVTYTVRTPSGGVHYYFRVYPDFSPAVRSGGYRKGWHIDVKASRNCWAATPPAPGYIPGGGDVAEIPYALAYYLRDGVRQLPRRDAQRRGTGVRAGREGILSAITAASGQAGGGWNSLIFWAACRYGEEGVSDEQALREICEAARCWNNGEIRRAERTIRSGLRTGRKEV